MDYTSLFNTFFARAYSLEETSKDVIKYLVETKGTVHSENSDLQRHLEKTAVNLAHPIVQLFKKIVEEDGLKNMILLDPSLANRSVPEVLTLQGLIIDGKDITDVKPMAKAWVNLAPYLEDPKKRSPYTTPIKEVTLAIESIVKSHLMMSYNDSDRWLSVKTTSFLLEFYTMAVMPVLRRAFNLNDEDYITVALILACYYANKLDKTDGFEDYPDSLKRATSIFKGFAKVTDLETKVSSINEARNGRQWNMSTVTELCREIGPDSMRNITEGAFFALWKTNSVDAVSTGIAYDYPPYLLFHFLKSFSGDKHYVFNNAIRTPHIKQSAKSVIRDILNDRKLIVGVERS